MSQKLNILLIEDCKKDAELIQRNLSKEKYVVRHENTLPGGLLALSNLSFDVVCLDLNLSNGRKPLKLMHDVDENRGNAATVVITGNTDPAWRDAMMKIGADGFMVKGVDDRTPADMDFVIARAIDHRQHHDKRMRAHE